jgi:SAM-dependent methyltransferase
MNSINVYEDSKRADSYSKLEFPGTYYLAYRDIPGLLKKYVNGNKAVDFGCGAGRSTRFLRKYGFDAVGVDISKDMIEKALELDPTGKYLLIENNNYEKLKEDYYDLVLSVFTFDNIPYKNNRINILGKLKKIINKNGTIILLDSTPDIYMNEWASFSTKNYPENKNAKSGEKVKIIMTDVEDSRPVEDFIWFHDDYIELFKNTQLDFVETLKPLGKNNEPIQWVNETRIAPWIIYVLKKL